jgi:hypothetical protein
MLTYLFVMLLGLALYLLGVSIPRLAWLSTLGIVIFGVALFYWLPGNHSASLR